MVVGAGVEPAVEQLASLAEGFSMGSTLAELVPNLWFWPVVDVCGRPSVELLTSLVGGGSLGPTPFSGGSVPTHWSLVPTYPQVASSTLVECRTVGGVLVRRAAP